MGRTCQSPQLPLSLPPSYPPALFLLRVSTAVKHVLSGLDVPMWEPTGEKTDLSEGNEKDKEAEAEEAPAVRGGRGGCVYRLFVFFLMFRFLFVEAGGSASLVLPLVFPVSVFR